MLDGKYDIEPETSEPGIKTDVQSLGSSDPTISVSNLPLPPIHSMLEQQQQTSPFYGSVLSPIKWSILIGLL